MDIGFGHSAGTFPLSEKQQYLLLNVWEYEFLETDQNDMREFFGKPLTQFPGVCDLQNLRRHDHCQSTVFGDQLDTQLRKSCPGIGKFRRAITGFSEVSKRSLAAFVFKVLKSNKRRISQHNVKFPLLFQRSISLEKIC